MPNPISNTLQIETYCHCALCIEECLGKMAPVNYARLSIGWTALGLQVWCERHKVNVVNIDFEGCKHPANTSRIPLSTGVDDPYSGLPCDVQPSEEGGQ